MPALKLHLFNHFIMTNWLNWLTQLITTNFKLWSTICLVKAYVFTFWMSCGVELINSIILDVIIVKLTQVCKNTLKLLYFFYSVLVLWPLVCRPCTINWLYDKIKWKHIPSLSIKRSRNRRDFLIYIKSLFILNIFQKLTGEMSV